MKTYLNELYNRTDENRNKNLINFTLTKKDKNQIINPNKKSKTSNNITQNKSGLFLNNYFRFNKKNLNNIELNSIKNSKKAKKKKINITPYQRMGNEYILNFALDNLNKYQENLLIKENNEDEKNNINNDLNDKIKYYNNFVENDKINKSTKSFRTSYKKNNTIKKQENIFNQYINNKNYSEYFIRNDLFNNTEFKNEIEDIENIPEPEPCIMNKYGIKNNTRIQNDINDKSNKNNNIDIKLNFTLSNLELNELKNVFQDNYIYFDDLFLLTKEDFVEMKIPIGPRNRLLNFIKKYKNYAKNFDLNELSNFMNKYKESINSNEIDKCLIETPSTNNKYKSITTAETNKNKGSNDSKEKRLNISNLEVGDSFLKKQFKKKKNNIAKDLNEIINQNYIEESNKRCNTYKELESNNYNNEEKENILENNTNLNDADKNIFSNSLLKDFTSNTTDYKDSNMNIINLNLNNDYSKVENNNNFVSKKSSPFDTKNNMSPIIISNKNINQNNHNNKKGKIQNNSYYKNYKNIFSEIEKYQSNYEKMKKENNIRNNKINNLLDKKNKTNIQYLKMKLKNSKYYNDEDLKNESVRNLDQELQKMNSFKSENILYNYSIKKKNIKNPLIDEFNKLK